MFNLTQQEKQIIIFLVLAIMIGRGISYYRKIYSRTALAISACPVSKAIKVNDYLQVDNLKVNINTATSEQLENLPHIGPTLAERIMNYREENGPFVTVEEIQKVKGIGLKKFDEIKELLSVK